MMELVPPTTAPAGAATWHALDDNGSAELRVNGCRITSFPSYSAADEAAQRINAAMSLGMPVHRSR